MSYYLCSQVTVYLGKLVGKFRNNIIYTGLLSKHIMKLNYVYI
jgi:hypothetical protein